jgi:hypothetical protein
MKVAMVNQTHPHQTQPPLLETTAQILQKYPFIVWGVSLVLVLLLGGVALKGLIYPGPVEPTETELAATPTQPKTPEVSEKDLNLWLFSAVALGCAAGSVLIARHIEQLGSQTDPAQPKQQTGRSQAETAQKRQPAKATRRSSNPMRRKKVAVVPVQRSQAAAVTVFPNQTRTRSQATPLSPSTVIEPVVTVVPENESHPLDWGEANLADMMDIRKQKPLSSLL